MKRKPRITRRANLLFSVKRGHRRRHRPRRNPHQTFHYLWYVWDIEAAERAIAKRRRPDLQEIDVDHVYGAINWSTPDRPTFGGVSVDPEYALRRADVSKPLLFGLIKDGSAWYSILIDGHHRLYRAKAEGLKSMPAYYLNKRENHHSMLGPRRAPLKN